MALIEYETVLVGEDYHVLQDFFACRSDDLYEMIFLLYDGIQMGKITLMFDFNSSKSAKPILWCDQGFQVADPFINCTCAYPLIES